MAGVPETPETDTDDVNAVVETWASRHEALETEWANRHSGHPPVLYHYTTADGFLGIVETRSLWASNAAFLNDSTELVYIVSVLDEIVQELDESGDEVSIRMSAFASLLRRGLTDLRAYDVYVACFCEAGDLLSQWRGYPRDGGGYSLGFDSVVLDAAQSLRRVVYDRPTQLDLVRSVLAPIKE